MAETGESSTEIQAHAATYGGFTKLMLWGTIAAFAVGVFVVFMIAS
ncbi:aa3-type cytochrome c oxidase subunit IV [Sphingomonas psychrotolerans]|uniref:Aa3-type cytochrome c oxidase subunit IV n=1 Tax=Sphingomonas psychrotolerans TaxID=1327635 RepID=A0ABU3N3Z9_9SPHN|nr:aa3-type cytochrome c oxidase subunit IV [Sphingomonas psychrotolerans]MDT8759006.1 aa3-type cytochrome c oxidase subunit IV [Sphingomonas psychrotolerans]